MDDAANLITEIEAFLEKAKMAETTFGARAVNNAHLVPRLRAGGTITTKTLSRVRAYIKAESNSTSRHN